MKLGHLALILGFLVVHGSLAFGDLTLPLVKYDRDVLQTEIWKHTRVYEVPNEVITSLSVATPSMAFDQANPNVFLQNEDFIVCYQLCSQPQNTIQRGRDLVQDAQGNFKINIDLHGIIGRRHAMRVLKLTNVYYWTSQLFSKMKAMGFVPAKRLQIRVDFDMAEVESQEIIENNAYFMESDWSLNFAKQDNGVLTRLFLGLIRSPAFDPSVILHEAAHSFIERSIGFAVDPSIGGVHEGIADYFAMMVTGQPQIGKVFIHRTGVRDARLPADKYKVDMEIHDSGQILATILWKIRTMASIGNHHTEEFLDRVAYKSLQYFNQNMFSSFVDIRPAFLNAFAEVGAERSLSETQITHWQRLWNASLDSVNITGASDNGRLLDLKAELRGRPSIDVSTLNYVVYSMRIDGEALNNSEHSNFNFGVIKKYAVQTGPDENDPWRVLWLDPSVETKPLDTPVLSLITLNDHQGINYPIWILMQEDRLLAAYTLDGTPLNRQVEPELYSQLIEISQLVDISRTGFENSDLLFKRALRILGTVLTGINEGVVSQDSIQLNDQEVSARRIQVNLGRRLRRFAEITSATVWTLPSSSVPAIEPVPELQDGAVAHSPVALRVQYHSRFAIELRVVSTPTRSQSGL